MLIKPRLEVVTYLRIGELRGTVVCVRYPSWQSVFGRTTEQYICLGYHTWWAHRGTMMDASLYLSTLLGEFALNWHSSGMVEIESAQERDAQRQAIIAAVSRTEP